MCCKNISQHTISPFDCTRLCMSQFRFKTPPRWFLINPGNSLPIMNATFLNGGEMLKSCSLLLYLFTTQIVPSAALIMTVQEFTENSCLMRLKQNETCLTWHQILKNKMTLRWLGPIIKEGQRETINRVQPIDNTNLIPQAFGQGREVWTLRCCRQPHSSWINTHPQTRHGKHRSTPCLVNSVVGN